MAIFSLLALGLAKAGKPARVERVLIMVCAGASSVMNFAAARGRLAIALSRCWPTSCLLGYFSSVVTDRVVSVSARGRHRAIGAPTSWSPRGWRPGGPGRTRLRLALALPSTAYRAACAGCLPKARLLPGAGMPVRGAGSRGKVDHRQGAARQAAAPSHQDVLFLALVAERHGPLRTSRSRTWLGHAPSWLPKSAWTPSCAHCAAHGGAGGPGQEAVVNIVIILAVILTVAACGWAFAPAADLPRNRVRHMRLRLRLRLHPGRGTPPRLRLPAVGPWRRCAARRAPPVAAARAVRHPRDYSILVGRRTTGRLRCRWRSTLRLPRHGTASPACWRTIILHYPGPVVSTTTKADVFQLTSGVRPALGPIAVLNPQRSAACRPRSRPPIERLRRPGRGHPPGRRVRHGRVPEGRRGRQFLGRQGIGLPPGVLPRRGAPRRGHAAGRPVGDRRRHPRRRTSSPRTGAHQWARPSRNCAARRRRPRRPCGW